MSSIVADIRKAGESGQLMASSVDNLVSWLEGGFLPDWAVSSIGELVSGAHWNELNDRFYATLQFGTGGMRNRTIGNVLTTAEKGTPGQMETPEHAAVGTNMMNDFNVVRATIGLFRYAQRYLEKKQGRREVPRLIIAHDVRHFSRHFCELAASTWSKLGGTAFIFDGPRSTPQLSYSVRYLGATAGIVITASHNPSHDNGYKVYFEDGAQVVFPHAEGIIHEVYQIPLSQTPDYFDVDLSSVITLGEAADEAYLTALSENVLDTGVFQQAQPKIVFTAIHGTGGITGPKILQKYGLTVDVVEEQATEDGRFPTVKSPNPENADALAMAIARANQTEADVVMATDPDADRMGVAVRGEDGEMRLLTGNQIGSLLAAYRITKMKDMGILPKNGSSRAALIKTFVTTPLQAAIAEKNGLKVIDTLTGFKWIGEKLRIYEESLQAALMEKEGIVLNYDAIPRDQRARLMLEHSTFYVFGGEESYGYLASDLVRDKDANAAVVMFAELAAALKRDGRSFDDYIDEVYLRYGYYLEDLVNIYYEGAAGSEKIGRILKSYREDHPKELAGFQVASFKDFGVETFEDADGKEIPKQDFYFLELDNGYQFAVRGSGTEPKIKFYVFAREDVAQPGDLDEAKAMARETIDKLKAAIEADARARAEG